MLAQINAERILPVFEKRFPGIINLDARKPLLENRQQLSSDAHSGSKSSVVTRVASKLATRVTTDDLLPLCAPPQTSTA